MPIAVPSIVLLSTLIAAVIDGRHGIIPNRLTLPLLVAAPLAHFFLGGPGALQAAVVGAGLCALVPLLLFVLGAMGGGDLKLLAALGAWLGPWLGMRVEVAAFLVTAAFAIVQCTLRGQLLTSLLASLRMLWPGRVAGRAAEPAQPPVHGTMLRFGPPLCAATWLVIAMEYAS